MKTNTFRGDLTDISAQKVALVPPEAWGRIVQHIRLLSSGEAFFKIELNYVLDITDTSILKIHCLIIKINDFRGDLSDISAITATLLLSQEEYLQQSINSFPSVTCFEENGNIY